MAVEVVSNPATRNVAMLGISYLSNMSLLESLGSFREVVIDRMVGILPSLQLYC